MDFRSILPPDASCTSGTYFKVHVIALIWLVRLDLHFHGSVLSFIFCFNYYKLNLNIITFLKARNIIIICVWSKTSEKFLFITKITKSITVYNAPLIHILVSFLVQHIIAANLRNMKFRRNTSISVLWYSSIPRSSMKMPE